MGVRRVVQDGGPRTVIWFRLIKRKRGGVHDEHDSLDVSVVALSGPEIELVARLNGGSDQRLSIAPLCTTGHAHDISILRAAVAALVGAVALLVKQLAVLLWIAAEAAAAAAGRSSSVAGLRDR